MNHGATTTFKVTPSFGYHATVAGCGGTLSGTTYTTGPITESCLVTVSFAQATTYTVIATADANGSISPTLQKVTSGETTTFTVTPNAGYRATVTGCGGTLNGTTYTTGPITANCTVTASFTVASTSGDINGDGGVNALDVVAVINAVLGTQSLPDADANGDGAVNALDVVFVINKVLGT